MSVGKPFPRFRSDRTGNPGGGLFSVIGTLFFPELSICIVLVCLFIPNFLPLVTLVTHARRNHFHCMENVPYLDSSSSSFRHFI